LNELNHNYEVPIPGEVLGLLVLLAAAITLWRFVRYEPQRARGLTLSLLSGVLLYLAFPPFDLGWLAWVALVPMIVAQLTCSAETLAAPPAGPRSPAPPVPRAESAPAGEACGIGPADTSVRDTGGPLGSGVSPASPAGPKGGIPPAASRVRRFLARVELASVYQALTLGVAYALVFMHVFPSELPTGFPVPVWPFILIAVALVACVFALSGLPGGSLSFHRKTGFRFFIIGPALGWMGLEQVRVITEMGQSWARIPGSQHANIPLIQLSTFGGEWLIGALVIAANYALALLLLRALGDAVRSTQYAAPDAHFVLPNGFQPFATLALVIAAHIIGYAIISTPTQTVRVAAIQLGEDLGDSPHYMTFWNRADWHGMDEAVLADFEPMIRAAAARGAKIIALPEAVLWEDPALNPLLQQRLLNVAKSTGAYITFPFYLWNDPQSRNEVYTASPSGEWLGPYAKNHPIAYIGEYSVTAGQFPVYDTAFGGLGNFVCYDNTYTDVASNLASRGASILTSSNHDWPEGAWGFYTQSIYRATENRVAIVRSDWRVGSAIIDPFGRVLASASLNERERTILVADVPVVLERGTVYTRTGDWLAYLGLATLAAMLLFSINWPRRRLAIPQPA
jgi:apolipoprotein N-acyltransferase